MSSFRLKPGWRRGYLTLALLILLNATAARAQNSGALTYFSVPRRLWNKIHHRYHACKTLFLNALSPRGFSIRQGQELAANARQIVNQILSTQIGRTVDAKGGYLFATEHSHLSDIDSAVAELKRIADVPKNDLNAIELNLNDFDTLHDYFTESQVSGEVQYVGLEPLEAHVYRALRLFQWLAGWSLGESILGADPVHAVAATSALVSFSRFRVALVTSGAEHDPHYANWLSSFRACLSSKRKSPSWVFLQRKITKAALIELVYQKDSKLIELFRSQSAALGSKGEQDFFKLGKWLDQIQTTERESYALTVLLRQTESEPELSLWIIPGDGK